MKTLPIVNFADQNFPPTNVEGIPGHCTFESKQNWTLPPRAGPQAEAKQLRQLNAPIPNGRIFSGRLLITAMGKPQPIAPSAKPNTTKYNTRLKFVIAKGSKKVTTHSTPVAIE